MYSRLVKRLGGMGAVAVLVFSVLATYGAIAAIALGAVDVGSVLRLPEAAINEERVRQAADTGAETLAVACPFCTVMLDDGVRTSGSDLRVADVATLLVESIADDPKSDACT